ncbi:MAG: cell division protein SepF [Micrococcaceae bacterium]
MAGGMKKAMIYLGLADGEEQYESEQRDRETRSEERAESTPEAAPRNTVSRPSDRTAARQAAWDGEASSSVELVDTDYRAPVTPIKRAAQAREESKAVHQLTTIHPRSYNDAKRIGESFRNNIPVIMNVTDMSESEAKRLVDFSAGLVFGLRGSIERVTNKVFLLTPADVEVVTEGQNTPTEETSFFNQN